MGKTKLSEAEQARLKELVALKKAGKLRDADSQELEALNRKCGFKGNGRRERRDSPKGKVPYGNDFAWWSKYPELLSNAAKIPFNWRPGTGLFPGGRGNELTDAAAVPGVMKIGYIPMCGALTGDSTDPFNTAFRALWLDMHRKYRGIGSYQQADLGMAMFAITNVFSLILTAERIVGYLMYYDALNLNLPTTLAAALGVNATLLDSIHRNSKDYIGYLNYLISKLKPLCLPKGLSFIQNLASCLSYVYLDSKDHRAQMIVFKQEGFWEFQSGRFTTGSSLKLIKDIALPDGYTDYESYLAAIEGEIDILLGDDDITRMCSDVLAAYGSNGVETMQMIPDGFALSPVYSEEMLHKVHNSNILNYAVSGSSDHYSIGNTKVSAAMVADSGWSWDETFIYQENNTAIGRFCVRKLSSVNINQNSHITDSDGFAREVDTTGLVGWQAANGGTLLDTWSENPDEKIVVEGSMFKHSMHVNVLPQGGNTYYEGIFDTIGVELLTNVIVFAKAGNALTSVSLKQFDSGYTGGTPRSVVAALAVFDWAFYLYGALTTSISDYRYTLPGGDINNAIAIRPNDLFRIHQFALLSAFKFDDVTYIN